MENAKISEYFIKNDTAASVMAHIPTMCPKCSSELEVVNNLHLTCVNELCSGKGYLKFHHGFKELKIDGSAGATTKKIFDAGITSIIDVLNYSNLLEAVNKGTLDNRKNFQKMISQIKEIKSLHLQSVIKIIGFTGMGNTISKQIANKIAGISYSFDSLEKAVCEGFNEGESKYNTVKDYCMKLNQLGIEVIYPTEEIVTSGTKTYELTGSPKSFGFKTKDEFKNKVSELGMKHTKLTKDTDYLISDDINGSSSKIKKALKLGVKVITYADAINL